MPDQADALRIRMVDSTNDSSPPSSASRVIAVASGKGGVGKSNVCVNFALGLQAAGHHPIVIDTDVGFANIELLLGVRPVYNLLDVLRGHNIWEVITYSPTGLPFLSAGTGLTDIHSLHPSQMTRMIDQLAFLSQRFDFVLIDSGAGMGANVKQLLSAADDLIIVTTPEPTAIADAYSLLKQMTVQHTLFQTRVVVNRAPSFVEARVAADKLVAVAHRFLNLTVTPLGFILEDDTVGQAVMRQQALLTAFPTSQAARCMNQLVNNYLRSESGVPKRGLSAFLERLSKRFRSIGERPGAGHSA